MQKIRDKWEQLTHNASSDGSGSSASSTSYHATKGAARYPSLTPHGTPDYGPKVVYPQPGARAPGPGKMPPKVKNLDFHEPMKFFHPKGHQHNVLRDLGHSGVLNGRIIWSFGDTLMGTEESHMICATDSVGIGHPHHRTCSVDTALWPNSDNVKEWIPTNAEEEASGGLSVWSYGGSNLVEIEPGKGLVFYLKMHRPQGKQRIVGAGVATVTMGDDMVPVAHRNGDHMWTVDEACYGDCGIAYNAQDGHVYAYGKGPDFDKELWTRVFLCRAPAQHVLDVSKYEYWDNKNKVWSKTRFTKSGANGTTKLENDHAIFNWMSFNQAYPFWSNYFNKWMFLYGTQWGHSDVFVKTADKLEGPWQDHGFVASTKRVLPDDPALRYAHTGHPEFDETGKTVLATWARNNVIWGVTIEWE